MSGFLTYYSIKSIKTFKDVLKFYLIYKMVVNYLSKIKLPEMLVLFISGMVFIVLALLERKFLTPDVLSLPGEGSHAQFQVWMFLFGFATAIIGEARE